MSILSLEIMDGMLIGPGVFLIGEPTPIEGTNLMRGLANVNGSLCVIEMRVTFSKLVTVKQPEEGG